GKGGNRAGAVAAVDAGLFDVFHDGTDHARLTVRAAIDIDFGRVLEKAVNKNRTIGADFDRAPHVTAQIFVVVDQLHGAAAENEGRPNEDWVTNSLRDRDRFLGADGGAARGLAQAEFVAHRGE